MTAFEFVDKTRHVEGLGFIDMDNVSNVLPAIHPLLSLSEDIVLGHTREFAAMCNTKDAYDTMLIASKSMALTGYTVIHDVKMHAGLYVYRVPDSDRGASRAPCKTTNSPSWETQLPLRRLGFYRLTEDGKWPSPILAYRLIHARLTLGKVSV